ncbi:EpsG family protein [Vibrio breoganii]
MRVKLRLYSSFSLVIILLLMFVLSAFNYSNPDYENYNLLFESVQNKGVGFITSQIGLVWLMKFASFGGSGYHFVLSIIFFIGLLILVSTFELSNYQRLLFLSLYIIYPFFLDLIQIKHFMSMCLFVLAIHWLYYGNTKLSLLALIAGSFFHYVALYFVPFVIVYKMNIKWTKFLFLSLLVLLVNILFVQTGMVQKILTIIFGLRIQAYLDGQVRGVFFVYLIYFMSVFSLVLFVSIGKMRNLKLKRLFDLVFYLNVFAVQTIPFCMMNISFFRIYRFVLVVNVFYILSALVSHSLSNRIIVFLAMFSLNLVMFYFTFGASFDTTVYSIFKNNLLWDVLRP